MNTMNEYEWIERYAAGQLSEEERSIFEQKLRDNPQLAAELSTHQVLMDSLKLYGNRSQLKKKLDVFHQEMAKDTTSQGRRLNKYSVQVFWKRHLPTMAVAASVAVITVIGTLFTMDYLRSLENRQISFYKELKRELNSIKVTQRNIASAVPEIQPEVRPVSYSATGFMVASNGYVVTNYHVINGADSVFIESRMDELCRYKVKEVYSDKLSDISILKITDPDFTSTVRVSYGFKIKEADLGEPVYTLGFPREDMVFGEGSISSKTGFEGDTTAYQISIPVNPGNSGGPLLDEKGNLIGMITGKNTAVEGAAFAIKSKYLLSLIDSIPVDSLPEPVLLSGKNYVKDLKRPEQIKQLQSLIFNVKVYHQK
ncbi:trypsin-like serine protease [Rhodocytophaga rosea]|uniref:Trypsin-like serine protease n=1 Tax=Rhodocytophaga rosea TaxID=2704465 RepID=A0A6C0GP28_9BACT|nr:S1C family serine protease [Rhodocytophaga rosea]QHT69604.1 trypsin-like serine protease [Rhodocytophaga rosea]